MPPRMPCKMTASNAARPSHLTQRRGSLRQSQIANMTISMPTMLATIRCPCSYKMPPTICDSGKENMNWPYVVGQSGLLNNPHIPHGLPELIGFDRELWQHQAEAIEAAWHS